METNIEAAKGWTETEQRVIALFIEKLGMERSNAVRKLRGMMLKGLKPEQILAQPLEPKLAQVQEPKAKKTKSTPKPKKEAKKKLSMSKEERMALAKKSDKSELEIYMGLCKKEGIEPAKSAQRAWDKAQKAAAKAKAAK